MIWASTISDKVRLKPAYSDTETSYSVETACSKLSYYIFQIANTKGADQTGGAGWSVSFFSHATELDFLTLLPI